MDAEQACHALSKAYESITRVLEGRCPVCGEVREDNDCRNCGHHSLYVKPMRTRYEETDADADSERAHASRWGFDSEPWDEPL